MKKFPRSRVFRAALVAVAVSAAFLGALTEGVAQTRQAPAPAPPGSASRGPVADAARVGDAFASVAERVSPAVVTLEVDGLTCNNCVRKLERALRDADGVTSAMVTLDPSQATVEGSARPADLEAVVRATGYAVK